MRRVFGTLAGVLMLAALPMAAASVGATGQDAMMAKKAMTATGTVSAVAADSLTVKGKTDEWTFTVDEKTEVSAKGASHKTEAMKADNKPTMITDFVHVGDTVSVKYHEMDGKKTASSVLVTNAKPGK